MPRSERFKPGLNGHLATKAATLVAKAVAAGNLKRPTACAECAAEPGYALHGHHEDYAHPLEVIWLCSRCHHRRHYIPRQEPMAIVSFDCDWELRHAFKYFCAVEDRTMSSVLTQAITEYLNAPSPEVS